MHYMLCMDIESWKSQLRKGAAELAVLSILDGRPMSGIGLLDHVKIYSEIGLSDGTLYPLLKRLERDGRVAGAWQLPETGGRPTKTYTISKDGKDALEAMRDTWTGFRKNLSDIVGDQ